MKILDTHDKMAHREMFKIDVIFKYSFISKNKTLLESQLEIS